MALLLLRTRKRRWKIFHLASDGESKPGITLTVTRKPFSFAVPVYTKEREQVTVQHLHEQRESPLHTGRMSQRPASGYLPISFCYRFPLPISLGAATVSHERVPMRPPFASFKLNLRTSRAGFKDSCDCYYCLLSPSLNSLLATTEGSHMC